ncbi:MAG: DUF2299 family protein [Salinigranum sp.]
MTDPVDADRIRAWIDDELVEGIERYPDEAAEFNYLVDMSQMRIHVVRRRPDGPLIVGQQIEYGESIRTRIGDLSAGARNDLVARIRETLTGIPVVYGFRDANGANVRFDDMSRIFLEHRIYPDSIGQQTLMDGLIDVWKAMRYLDDIVTLIDSVER